MITKSKQVWEVGKIVKVGFLSLIVTGREPTPGDYMPDAYWLCSKDGTKRYRFVPHNGLERLEMDAATKRAMIAFAQIASQAA